MAYAGSLLLPGNEASNAPLDSSYLLIVMHIILIAVCINNAARLISVRHHTDPL